MESASRIRVLLVDTPGLCRAGLASLIGAAPGFALVAEAGPSEWSAYASGASAPDLCVIDPFVSGSDPAVLRRLSALLPATRLVVLTATAAEAQVDAAARAGADAYILKSVDAPTFLEVLGRLAVGDLDRPPQELKVIGARPSEVNPVGERAAE